MKTNKILPFEALVLGLLFLILVIVGAMGSYTFKRLNAIVVTISNQAKPDNRLGIMKDILSDLYRSEISVKSYRLTKDDNYLMDFYLSAKNIQNRIDQLREFTVLADTMYYATDSMSILIEQEYEVLEALLKVKDEYRVKVALDKAMETVDKNITTIEKIEAATLMDTITSDAVQIDQQTEEKSNFFKRIFGSSKRKKKNVETIADTTGLTMAPFLEVAPDTMDSDSKLERINQNLAKLSKKETAQEVQMNVMELQLIKKSEMIMQQIRDLLIGMEIYQMKIVGEKSKKTEELAREIKNLIALFTAAAVFLILLAAAITVNYVRKNNQYKKVLRDAREKAELLALEKERFLANMSHEIRTPMNAIIGYTEQLLYSDLAKEQREQLEIVSKAGKHLIQIINEVLDYSTMQAGKTVLKKEDFSPHEIISDVVLLVIQIAQKKNIKLIYNSEITPVTLIGDAGRFRQILLNLLSNAIKYTEHGDVTINAAQKVIDNRRIQLSVSISDTGIGMSEDFLKKVFDEFERADIVADKTNPGSGLGLAITKQLIKLHRGRIQLKSEEGKGTTVKILLPYQISGKVIKEIEQEPRQKNNISGLKFLVVDDVAYNRKLIGAILKRNNASYKEAKNGQEAIDILNNEDFDIILMDIRMPLIDGITATKVINKITENVKVIALTASTSEKEKEEYLQAGIKRILLKPIREKDLLQAIYELSGNQPQDSNEKTLGNNDKFSLDELWKLCQNDKAFFNEMLDTFINTAKDTLALMKIAFNENDLKQIAFLAHRLSGPTMHVGAKSLLDYLKVMENNKGENLELVNLSSLLSNTEKELEEIIQFISISRHKY